MDWTNFGLLFYIYLLLNNILPFLFLICVLVLTIREICRQKIIERDRERLNELWLVV